MNNVLFRNVVGDPSTGRTQQMIPAGGKIIFSLVQNLDVTLRPPATRGSTPAPSPTVSPAASGAATGTSSFWAGEREGRS